MGAPLRIRSVETGNAKAVHNQNCKLRPRATAVSEEEEEEEDEEEDEEKEEDEDKEEEEDANEEVGNFYFHRRGAQKMLSPPEEKR